MADDAEETVCPDRTGQVWEEIERPEHAWQPGELERFAIVGPPKPLERGNLEPPWIGGINMCHPIVWLDDIPDTEGVGEDGINEQYIARGWYTRLA